MKELRDYIRVFDGVFNELECKQLISLMDKESDYVEYHDTELYEFEQLNLNTTPTTKMLAQVVCRKLIPLYDEYFMDLYLDEFVDINAFEHVRIKHYRAQTDQQFRTHVDVTDAESAKRFCIAIAYLNDNNGRTTFPQIGHSVEPKTGRVVIFPPTWMFPHNGLPPTDNDKYILMTSLHYQ